MRSAIAHQSKARYAMMKASVARFRTVIRVVSLRLPLTFTGAIVAAGPAAGQSRGCLPAKRRFMGVPSVCLRGRCAYPPEGGQLAARRGRMTLLRRCAGEGRA